MPCHQPFRDDPAQLLLYKIASCIASGAVGGVGGVTSFNARTGAVTLLSADVTGALGFTPLSQAAGDARYVLKTGDTMTGALAIGNGALVASTPYLDLSQTWNNGAVIFTGLKSNVTLTAASTSSYLFDFQVDGTERFSFSLNGFLRAVRQEATDSGVNLFLRKRGNVGGATNAVAANATIGSVQYSGWDGAAFANGARISGRAEGAWTGASHGTRLDCYTTPTGSTSEQLTLAILQTGQLAALDGTFAAPSYSFQNDLNTGLLIDSVNDPDKLFITAGGSLAALFAPGYAAFSNLDVSGDWLHISGFALTAASQLGFFFAGPVVQQAAPGNTLAEVLAALRAYGLLAP